MLAKEGGTNVTFRMLLLPIVTLPHLATVLSFAEKGTRQCTKEFLHSKAAAPLAVAFSYSYEVYGREDLQILCCMLSVIPGGKSKDKEKCLESYNVCLFSSTGTIYWLNTFRSKCVYSDRHHTYPFIHSGMRCPLILWSTLYYPATGKYI